MTTPFNTGDDGWTFRAWFQDVHCAAATLTRLPLPHPPAAVALNPRVRRAYPLVGAFVGLAAGGVFFAAHDVGLPLVVGTVLCVAALILLGGHMDDHGQRAAGPLLVATMIKLATIYVIGNIDTPDGGPHMVVVALTAAGALSHAAALLFEPSPVEDEESGTSIAPTPEVADPKVVIMPPDGTQISEEDMDEGNGRDLGPAATGIIIALIVAAVALGLLPGAVAAGGAAIGTWIAPKMLAREIDSEVLPLPLALQQSGEVWALLALAVLMTV
ncbi:MAG: hypothetical protein ACFB0Z_01510 [Candidatus Phaeomarinobacter sp.]